VEKKLKTGLIRVDKKKGEAHLYCPGSNHFFGKPIIESRLVYVLVIHVINQ
jgi:hypothetical protein